MHRRYWKSLNKNSSKSLRVKTQGVIGVSRLRPRNGQKNPGLRFRFRGRTLPQDLRAGFEDLELRPWRRSPLLCRLCAAYGHTSKHCRSDQLRCLKCTEPHATDDCQSSRTCCPQCAADHAASDRRCPVLTSYFKRQANSRQDAPTTPEKTTSEASTQTTTTPNRRAATESKSPCVKTTSSQTEDLPGLSPEEEEPDRWRRRTRQDTQSAAVPPPVPDRPSRWPTPQPIPEDDRRR